MLRRTYTTEHQSYIKFQSKWSCWVLVGQVSGRVHSLGATCWRELPRKVPFTFYLYLTGTTSEGPFYLFTFYLLPLLDGNHLGRFLLPITNYYQLPRKVPITDSGMVDMGFPTWSTGSTFLIILRELNIILNLSRPLPPLWMCSAPWDALHLTPLSDPSIPLKSTRCYIHLRWRFYTSWKQPLLDPPPLCFTQSCCRFLASYYYDY